MGILLFLLVAAASLAIAMALGAVAVAASAAMFLDTPFGAGWDAAWDRPWHLLLFAAVIGPLLFSRSRG
jgi:hypothetical protein